MVWLWFPQCRKETYRILISLAPKSSMNETAALHSACVINGLHACKCLIQYICSNCFQKGQKKKKENIRFLGLMYVTWQHEYIRSSTETYNSSTVHRICSLFIFIWTLINVLAFCLEISCIFLPFWLRLSLCLKRYDMPSYSHCKLGIFELFVQASRASSHTSNSFLLSGLAPLCQILCRRKAAWLCWRPYAHASLLRTSYIIFQS